MNVLIACEESQTVCKEFRKKGHNAFSCDIQSCSGGHPEWHIEGDVLEIINGCCTFLDSRGGQHSIDTEWDLIICHPPCTYMTNGGAVRMFRKQILTDSRYGTFQMVNVDRVKKMIQARDFFMALYNANCEKICIENPMPMSIAVLPKQTQVVQPYEYGDPFSKKTYLWLKGLDKLKPTNVLEEYSPMINGGGGRTERKNYKGKKFACGSKNRSKTFTGIAKAMADQWG